MLRKIDIGIDKNLLIIDPRTARGPKLKFLADDIPKSPEESLNEAIRVAWPNWINAEPMLIGHVDDDGQAYMFFISDVLKKKVILLDFWDYTLLPCRRALSYSLEWHRRYGYSGLMIIGIHAPMFEFGKERKLVTDAVRELGIPYPVVLDNDFALWKSVENRYWPRRILLDGAGKTHLDVAGEGSYGAFEKQIQLLLRELSPGLPCPPVRKPIRRIDDPDYEIPETSSDIFFGTKKDMRLGNAQTFKADNEEVIFKDEAAGNYLLERPYLDGGWFASPESIYGTPHKGDVKLTVKFTGTDVYVVTRSRSKNPNDKPQGTKLLVAVDRKPVGEDQMAGTDLTFNEVRKTVAIVRDPKLYHIATKLDAGAHEVSLTVAEDLLHTIEIFGLFFEHGA